MGRTANASRGRYWVSAPGWGRDRRGRIHGSARKGSSRHQEPARARPRPGGPRGPHAVHDGPRRLAGARGRGGRGRGGEPRPDSARRGPQAWRHPARAGEPGPQTRSRRRPLLGDEGGRLGAARPPCRPTPDRGRRRQGRAGRGRRSTRRHRAGRGALRHQRPLSQTARRRALPLRPRELRGPSQGRPRPRRRGAGLRERAPLVRPRHGRGFGELQGRGPVRGIELIPVENFPEVRPGDDLDGLVADAVGGVLRAGDVLVVTHKVMSKAEGRLVDLTTVDPSPLAKEYAARWGKDPRQIEVVFRESRRIVRMDRGVVISETRHGFVCANAGVDASNVPGAETVCLLPIDPDRSASRLREALHLRLGVEAPVVVSDSFGRAWRFGITDVAIGVSGMDPLADYRGQNDPHGYPMEASVLAVADEVAAAAELVMGKTDGVPVAIVRGYDYGGRAGTGRDLLMPPERDMFR